MTDPGSFFSPASVLSLIEVGTSGPPTRTGSGAGVMVLVGTGVGEAVAPGPTDYDDAVIAHPDILGYWTLREATGNAIDLTANIGDGTYTGSVTRNVAGPGSQIPGGVGISGGYIEIPDHPDMDLGSAFTVEMWLKVVGGLTSDGGIFGRGEGTGNPTCRFVGTTGIRWATDIDPHNLTGSPVTTIKNGSWHQVVFVHDNGQKLIYLDSVEVANDTVGGTPDPSSEPWLIGRAFNTNTNIQHAAHAIYGAALTQPEIEDNYLLGIT